MMSNMPECGNFVCNTTHEICEMKYEEGAECAGFYECKGKRKCIACKCILKPIYGYEYTITSISGKKIEMKEILSEKQYTIEFTPKNDEIIIELNKKIILVKPPPEKPFSWEHPVFALMAADYEPFEGQNLTVSVDSYENEIGTAVVLKSNDD